MRTFIYSAVVNLGLAATALAAPNYFDSKPIDTSFVAGKPVTNGTKYEDIIQYRAPTCSLMAALSSAAHTGIDLAGNIKYLGDNDYSVRLFVSGRLSHLVVPFNGWTKHDPEPNDKGAFWAALYQRAYLSALEVDCSDPDPDKWAVVKTAKDPQSWQSMDIALRVVTGKPVVLWRLEKDDPADTVNRLREALKEKRCVVIGTYSAPVEGKVCLVAGHAYTVLAAGPDWIEVRNPWGHDISWSTLAYAGSKNGKEVYSFKEGYSDGKNDDPNDGIVRVYQSDMKFFDYAAVTK